MSLPIVNIFSDPYEVWEERQATSDEMLEHFRVHKVFKPTIRTRKIASISTHVGAASYMANRGADNGLENFIDTFLNKSLDYKLFRNQMPSKTPPALFVYQQKYPNYSMTDVDKAINEIGETLSDGQYLFHGGLWPDFSSNSIELKSPFSTSFCPQIALRNAEWRGQAYDAGQIDLFVLRAVNPQTNVFTFPRKGTKLGNEKEVLFASGSKLLLRNRMLIKKNYNVVKSDGGTGFLSKDVPIFVIQVDIS
ncbi:hypothetical protein ABQ333_26825 [Serratia fonticola]|uniref:hypothetical protein n=1 Tax=Serratia fonticola TaxID=47917 RepID=UPI003AAAA859